ncbi:MAG: response regulator [Desulfobacterales bacterium]|nr:response regulator [Desulfobacterales bacterium]
MIGSKILIVDDEEIFAGNMAKLLITRKYNVTTVHNGEDALLELEKTNFDVVVLDLKMPGMDGLATLKEIKKLGVLTQILMLTGHGSIDSALEAVKLGAYDYLTKPCDIFELVRKIEGAWKIKDKEEKIETQEKIQKIIESPKSVFSMFPK